MFDQTSRYADVATYTVPDASGRSVTIVTIRFIPPTPGVTSRRIEQQDRPDLLAHQTYQAPEQFWRIADANEVLDPAELVDTPGKRILIPARP